MRANLFSTLPLCLSLIAVCHASNGPLTPEQAIASFKIEPGLKVELVAAEPMVIDPVAIAFDEKGRMFVAEDRGYPTGAPKGQPPAGKIALLQDTDRDGKFDKRTDFAEGLTFPNGIMPWKGGIYVTCAPDLFYFKDTDGDGKADVKKVVFSGFQHLSTTQLRLSHPTLSIDNWVYMNCGLTASKVTCPSCPERGTLSINRLDFRFRPDSCDYEEVSGTGQFGGTFDSFGRRFIVSNRNHSQHVVMQGRYLRRNPHLTFSEYVYDTPEHGAASKVYPLSHNITTAASHTGYFTSACGLLFYTGNALPPEYAGNSFVCEPAGNLIHRDVLAQKGATFTAKRAFATNEFLASSDNWFRPVNLSTGPDGALYICDMYRLTIEHPDYLPEATRKITDFDSGKDKGRIYRVVSATHKSKAFSLPDYADLKTKPLCDELKTSDGWKRMTAHRMLLQRRDLEAVPALTRILRNANNAEARAHSLRLLESFDSLPDDEILQALKDKHPGVREHAIQVSEKRLANSPKLADAVSNLSTDNDPRVRFQCALSLGEIAGPQYTSALAEIAARDAADKWTRAAVLSSIGSNAEQFMAQLIPVVTQRATNEADVNLLVPLLSELGRTLGANTKVPTLSLLRDITKSERAADFPWQLALLSGVADGMRSSRTNHVAPSSPLMTAVMLDSSTTPLRVRAFLQQASKVAVDQKQPVERRLAAINLLAHSDFEQAGGPLQEVIDPRQPLEVQIAAARALSQMSDPAAGTALVKRERWDGYTQPVKDSVLTAMLAQPKLLETLLTAVERGDVSPLSINSEKRNQLMKHKDEKISQRAAALFKDLIPGDRMKTYEEYKEVLTLKPNVANGHKIFAQACLPCHVFSGEGYPVGPDLTGIRNQPADVLLLHILVPEFEIMPIYTQYNVETKDDRSVSGILAGETPASITLRQASGIEEKIDRSTITSMKSSSLSLMPQELEKTMSKQDLADLIGFLKGQQ